MGVAHPSWPRFILLVVLATLFSMGLLVPLGALIREVSFAQNFVETMFDPLVIAIVKSTLRQAAASTLIALALGFPLGLWVASTSQRAGLRFTQRLLALPFGVPTLVAVTSWVAIFGRQGLLASLGWEVDILYSWAMVIFAHVFFNIPYVALLVSEARAQISHSKLESVRVLGANGTQIFRFLVFPVCKPALLTASLQVFNLCTMSFAVVLILGGGPPVATMETAIYERLRLGAFDLTSASACALWQLGINIMPALLLARHIRPQRFHGEAAPSRPSTSRGAWHLVSILLCTGFVLPYFSFLKGVLNVAGWKEMAWAELSLSVMVTLRLALLTSMLTLFLSLLATVGVHVYRRRPLIARMLLLLGSFPAGVSALVLGVGVWLAYGAWIDPFSGNIFLIAAIQSMLFFPIIFRILLANLMGYRERSIELLACLGAPPLKAFFIAEWPRWRRPLVAAWSIVLGASVAEVSAVTLFAGEGDRPLPVVIQQLLGQYRFAEAEAATALLFLMALALMTVASRSNFGGASHD